MNLCGHATVAAISALIERKGEIGSIKWIVETLAGIIDVEYNSENEEVTMTQVDAEFAEFTGNKEELMKTLDLSEKDLDDRYPIMYGNTGTWTLIVPIKSLNSFHKMHPHNSDFPKVLKENPHSSIHPITLETFNKNNHMHGRHFSSCYSGTIEDPVTGTASGVMSAYYIKYIEPISAIEILIEQGQEIGKDGLVYAWAEKYNNGIKVRIAGTAVKVKQFEITI
jgi:PhzF family phenazine biosynthesis protein